MSKRIKRLQKIWVGLPKRIKIGPTWWTVTFEENLSTMRDGESRGLFGKMLDRECELVFNPDQGFGQARDTVLHEVLHAIRTNTVMDRMDAVSGFSDLDEAICLSYTPYLLMVIQDNPGLVDWLQKPEVEEETNELSV